MVLKDYIGSNTFKTVSSRKPFSMGCLSQRIGDLIEKAKILCKTYSELAKSLGYVRQGVEEVAKAMSKTPKALEYHVETRESKIAELIVRASGGIVKLHLPSLLSQVVASGVVWGTAELASRALRRKKLLRELLAEYYCEVSTATLE